MKREATAAELAEWRENREPGWYRDVGYRLQTILGEHRYSDGKGSRPTDPGWHTCSCGSWEGYWSSFHPHVADHLRADATRVPAAASSSSERP